MVNRTQKIELNPWIEFDWVGHSNQIERGSLCEFQSYSIEQIELNRTQSMLQIVFDWVRQPNFISDIIQWIAFDCVVWVNSLEQTFVVMWSVWSRKHEKHESWYTRIKKKIVVWVWFGSIAELYRTQSMDWVRFNLVRLKNSSIKFDRLCRP